MFRNCVYLPNPVQTGSYTNRLSNFLIQHTVNSQEFSQQTAAPEIRLISESITRFEMLVSM